MPRLRISFALYLLCAAWPTFADSPAEVIGRGFGSLDCLDIRDPDAKLVCRTSGVLANSGGCLSLSSSTLRERCMDQRIHYGTVTPTRVKPKKVVRREPLDPAFKQQLKGIELDNAAQALGYR